MTELPPTASGPSGARPTGTPTARERWVLVGSLVVAQVMGAAAGVYGISGSDGDSGAAQRQGATAPLELSTVTDDTAQHYRFAEDHQQELAAIPCFCGCEEFVGHDNLYDCFIRTDGAGYDNHAAGCGVCIGESAVASQLLDDGMSATEVAERITEQFGTTPVTSPDQTAPRT